MQLFQSLVAQSQSVQVEGTPFGVVAIVGILALVGAVFWIWMLIDAITNLPSGNEKIIWVLVIIFTGFIGALIYFLIGRKRA